MGESWTPARAAEFKQAYLDFEKHVWIDSKERGRICLADHVYEGQRRLLDRICDGLSDGIHDIKCLKSRQLGISTRARAIGIFWLGLFDGLKGAMIFDDGPNKENARTELISMIENLPAKVDFPRIKRQNRDMLILSNDSTVQFRAAGTKRGTRTRSLGTSLGINLLIASEMVNWRDEEGVISLQQALAKTYENRLFLWESTPRGFEGVWYDMWHNAVADDLTQRAIFIGWWAHPLQRFGRETPQFARYGLTAPNEKESKRIAEVQELYGWTVTMEQLAWYRWLMDPQRRDGEDDEEELPEDLRIVQEQPWTAREAFLLTGANFFDSEVLTRRMETALTARPSSVWKFFPSTDFFSTDFAPARTRRDVQLTVWEDPVPAGHYVLAADVAFGHDEHNDRSVCEIFRAYADGLDQVAEFASASTPTHQFAWLIMALCGWYAQAGNATVAQIIEINGPGEAVLREMENVRKAVTGGHLYLPAKEHGLKDIFNNVRQFLYRRSDSAGGVGRALHLVTTSQIKVALMERLRDEVHRGTLLLRSPALVDEMRTIIREGDAIGASGIAKDDRVYTTAMAIRAWEDQLMRLLSARRITREVDQARTALSPSARYELFTRYQLDTMFKKKEGVRAVRRAKSARAAWRFR